MTRSEERALSFDTMARSIGGEKKVLAKPD